MSKCDTYRPDRAGRWTTSRGWFRSTKGTLNQALRQTAGADRFSATYSSLWPPPLLSWVVRRPNGGIR